VDADGLGRYVEPRADLRVGEAPRGELGDGPLLGGEHREDLKDAVIAGRGGTGVR
jgi:hypothetical protein